MAEDRDPGLIVGLQDGTGSVAIEELDGDAACVLRIEDARVVLGFAKEDLDEIIAALTRAREHLPTLSEFEGT